MNTFPPSEILKTNNNMHWKLFATIAAAVVAAAVISYLIIRWLHSSAMPQLAGVGPKREIGFAAMMKPPGKP
jgi:hypothetical protein